MRPTLWFLVLGALGLAGCGERDEPRAAAATQTPEPTATATPAATAPTPATSVQECLALWNADPTIGSTHQVSHTEFVAELARKGRTPALVQYQRRHCYVVVPIGPRRIAWFAAWQGRAPYTTPTRRGLKAGERVPYNGRARRDGRIDPR